MEKRSKILTPDEAECRIQAECFQWHKNKFATRPERQYPVEVERMRLFMVNNTPRNPIHGNQLRAQGLVKGVADLQYLLPDGKTAFIEMKAEKGDQEPEQKTFEVACKTLDISYFICRSLEEFQQIICSLQN